MRKIIISVVWLILLNSCKSVPKLDTLNKDINKCVKGRTELVKKDFSLKEEFDLYQFYLTIEEILIKEKFLESKSKESYKNLFKEIESLSWDKKNETKYNDLLKSLDSLEYYNLTDWSFTILLAPFECNRFFIEKHNLKESKYFSDYYLLLFRVATKNEMTNWRLNNKLLESTPNREFSNIVYRASIISLFYENLKYYFLFKDKPSDVRGRDPN